MEYHPPHLYNYRLIRILGSGSNGDVHLLSDECNEIVRKTVPLNEHCLSHAFLTELDLMRMLQGMPNIAQFVGYSIPIKFGLSIYSYIYLEVYTMDLYEYISTRPRKARKLWTDKLLQDIARALYVCNSLGISQCDVKPENILVDIPADVEQPPTFYLSDFGLSQGPVIQTHLCGTIGYVAPEFYIPDVKLHPFAHDYFSLGITVYNYVMYDYLLEETSLEIYKQLYPGDLEHDMQNGCANGHLDVSKIQPYVNSLTLSIIENLCQYNPHQRHSGEDILKLYNLQLPNIQPVFDRYSKICSSHSNNFHAMAEDLAYRYSDTLDNKIYNHCLAIIKYRCMKTPIPKDMFELCMNILRKVDFQIYNPNILK